MTKNSNSTLLIHNNEVDSIFETLGTDENDLSYSLGYVMSKTPRFLKSIIKKAYNRKLKFKDIKIKLQEFEKGRGITDFEITIDNEFFCIIEAKKGWTLPDTKQLKRYLKRFRGYKKSKSLFIILSDCTEEYVKEHYTDSLYNIPIKSIAWDEVIKSINIVRPNATHKEKYLLQELKEYLQKVIEMENKESNWVYVVSLRQDTPSWSKIPWRDIINKKRRYFYPVDKNWPKIPPNYMGFRYDGKLQSIHFVEKYEVVSNMHKHIPEIEKGGGWNHYLLYLGAPFEPRKELPNGNIWSNGRVWCMLDTLFTSKTIKEACEISKKR